MAFTTVWVARIEVNAGGQAAVDFQIIQPQVMQVRQAAEMASEMLNSHVTGERAQALR
jgi:hypothetical protein